MVEKEQIPRIGSESEVEAQSRRLKSEQDRFERLTANLPAMVYQAVSYPDGRTEFTYLSPSMRTTYEISDDDPRSVTEALFASIHPEDRDEVMRSNAEAIARVEPWSGMHRIILPSGQTRWVEGSSNPARRPDGTVEWDGLIVDITERREAELALEEVHRELEQRVLDRTRHLAQAIVKLEKEIKVRQRAEAELADHRDRLEDLVRERTAELEIAKDQAESADRLKSAFLATMSHELRTPMNSIIGFTGILLQGLAGEVNPEQKKQLSMVRNSANHLLELINDVLDISKIEAGQLRLIRSTFDLAEVVEAVLSTAEPLAEAKNLDLASEIPDCLFTMSSDLGRVRQILLNLVGNAIKFTETGRIRLTSERRADAVAVTVSDTGIGIAKEDLGDLFIAFRQVDSGLRRHREGSGLGLAISKRLAAMLGGDITVESTLGEGSSFTVVLPLDMPEGAAP